MNKNIINYGRQSIDQKDIKSMIEVLKSDLITQGPLIENFEAELISYFGSDYACAVANGTAALHITAIAMGWKPNDIILTTPISFLATANCIEYVGAKTQFCDISLDSYNIDPNSIIKNIKSIRKQGKKVKGIIGVDYAGHPCDWEILRSIADEYELQLINDNCHSIGAEYDGDLKYAVKFADAVTHSYHPVKNITCGEGGSVLTNKKSVYEKIMRLRSHGIIKSDNFNSNTNPPWYYEMHSLGYNYRITDFQCSLGISQLTKLNNFIFSRRKIANRYEQAFKDCEFITTAPIKPYVSHAFHLYPILIDFEKIKIDKTKFFFKMKENNINLQVHYIPIHLQPYYKKKYGYEKGDYPKAEYYYNKTLSLPIYPKLKKTEQDKVIDLVLKLING